MNLTKEAKEIIRTLEENNFYIECPCCGEPILLKDAGLFYLDDVSPEAEKVIFRPIDYVVFDGMKKESIKNIILLDRQEKGPDHRALQKSIEKVVEPENYKWQTLRVQEDGKIKVE